MPTMTAKDGFEDYTLGRAYGEYEAGEVIRVDPDRKMWLDENGYGKATVAEAAEAPSPAPMPVIRRRKSPLAELETPPNIPDLTIRET